MPTYVYECADCYETFKVRHGMSEVHELCDACASPHITRIPTAFTNLTKDTPQRKKAVGETTTEFIENSRADLRAQKQELEKKR